MPSLTPRKLILHAGPHKTGTSSIQAVLRGRNFNSFYYPRTGQWHDGAHHHLVFSLIPELRRADGESVEPPELLLRLQEELRDVQHDTLLISSEFLSQPCLNSVVNWLIDHHIVDAQGIRAVLVERDELSRAASLYNQAVKDPYIGETRDPDQWLEEERSTVSLAPIITRFQQANIEVEVLPYEPADSLLQRFLLAVGVDEDELPEQTPWTNMSMSEPVLRALLDVNRTISDPLERIAHRTRLFAEIQPAFLPSSPQLFGCVKKGIGVVS